MLASVINLRQWFLNLYFCTHLKQFKTHSPLEDVQYLATKLNMLRAFNSKSKSMPLNFEFEDLKQKMEFSRNGLKDPFGNIVNPEVFSF
jgi:hypothetical protein